MFLPLDDKILQYSLFLCVNSTNFARNLEFSPKLQNHKIEKKPPMRIGICNATSFLL
jgi:hypothetical protein